MYKLANALNIMVKNIMVLFESILEYQINVTANNDKYFTKTNSRPYLGSESWMVVNQSFVNWMEGYNEDAGFLCGECPQNAEI